MSALASTPISFIFDETEREKIYHPSAIDCSFFNILDIFKILTRKTNVLWQLVLCFYFQVTSNIITNYIQKNILLSFPTKYQIQSKISSENV